MQDYWDACLQTLEGHCGWISSVALSHDSKYLASASRDKTVKIWRTSSGQCIQTLEEHCGSIRSVVFSHDSKYLASASFDQTVRIWDRISSQCLQTLEGHHGWVNSVAFSHDSNYLASASDDKTVKIWRTSSGQCMQTLEGHCGSVRSVVFSQDSNYLATASIGIRIWDVGSGQCLRSLAGHVNSVHSVAFSQDTKYVASASFDGTSKIWELDSGECLQTLITGRSTFPGILSDFIDFCHPSEIEEVSKTNIALITSDSTPPDTVNEVQSLHRCQISSDGRWILWNSKSILWIPPEYRPSSWAVGPSLFCIGCDSGRVLIFKLVMQESSDQRSLASSIGITLSSSAPISRHHHLGTSLPELASDGRRGTLGHRNTDSSGDQGNRDATNAPSLIDARGKVDDVGDGEAIAAVKTA